MSQGEGFSVNSIPRRAFLLGGAMAGVAVAGELLQPKPVINRPEDIPDLDSIVPVEFSEWVLDKSMVPLEVPADLVNTLNTIYDKTLSRTYINKLGQRIMLSLAYGANQSRALQLHKPEVCYVAQGFRVTGLSPGVMGISEGDLPVMRLVGQLSGRIEPITYWMRIGDRVVRGWFEQNRTRIKYGLQGLIPDGLLFRVSSISGDSPAAYALQTQFVRGLLENIRPENRPVLIGKLPFST